MQHYCNFIQDQSGSAIAGATVLVSQSGVTSTLYSDDGVTPQTNPMTTDALGAYSFYAANGNYDITVTVRAATITPEDSPITLFDFADAVLDLGFVHAGPGVLTLTTTADSNVTFPTSGTLATRAGVEPLTNKSISSSTVNSTVVGGSTPAAGTFTALTGTSVTGGGFRSTDYATGSQIFNFASAASSYSTQSIYSRLYGFGTMAAGATHSTFNSIIAIDQADAQAVDFLSGMAVVYRAAVGAVGSRVALESDMGVTGLVTAGTATGDFVSQLASAYSVGASGGTGVFTTGPDEGYFLGLFGGNDHTRLASGATYWYGAFGREINVEIEAGASAYARLGLSIVTGPNAASQAFGDDAGLAFSNSFTSTIPWKHGIKFGLTWGTWPFNSSSTLIGAQKRLYPTSSPETTINAAYGVDFSSVTFATAAFKSTGFSVDGDGNLTAASLAVGTAGGAVWVTAYAANLAELTTDAGPAAQAAIDHAAATGARAVYFPALPGGAAYYFPLGSTALDPGDGDLVFFGDGMYASILQWDEGPGTNNADLTTYHPLFLNRVASDKGRLHFRDLQFKGTLMDVGGRRNTGGPALYLERYSGVHIDKCRFYGIGCFAMANERITNASVTNCEFDYVMRDQARFRSSLNVLIDGNYFGHSDDDSVALHQASYIQGVGQINRGHVVTNNIFEDTLGVHCLGARQITVTNNIFRRCKVGCVRIERNAGEGMNQLYAVKVTGNLCLDTLARPPFATSASNVIAILPIVPRIATAGTFIPGGNDSVGITVVAPFDYLDDDDNDALQAIAPAYGVIVDGNTVMRTLPAVAAYSDWGFGEAFTNAVDISTDPAVVTDSMRPTKAVLVGSNVVGLSVRDNVLMNCQRGVSLADVGAPAMCIGRITDNTVYDCLEYGVFFEQVFTTRLRIEGNDFNLDPYLLSPGRAADGAWINAYAPCYGIYGPSNGAMRVTDNTFENLYQATSISAAFMRDNIVRGQIFAVGWSGANYGVGNVPAADMGITHQFSLAQPSDVNYGKYAQASTWESAAIPSTGRFVLGQFVRCTSPAVAGVYGWQRLTTGTAHVVGTDWKEVVLT